MPLAAEGWYFYLTMVDPPAPAESCRMCGAPLNNDQSQVEGICGDCAGAGKQGALGDNRSAYVQFESSPISQPQFIPDPDRPPWGPFTGISIWLVSVAAIVVIPVIAVVVWLVIQSARGAPLPNFGNREEIEQWVMSPNILLLQIGSTVVAHAITLAICWAVVTRLGSRPFWASIGWNWGGRRIWYWVALSACVLLAIQILSQFLVRVLPEKESSFDQLLKSSQQVRIAVAVLAVFTAPLVEEVIYRGLLFSSLRNRIGLIATVIVVTVTFAGVHVFQNRGAWVTITGLAVLSLALTMVRARTKSVLPCFFMHTLNNAVASVVILTTKGS